MKVAIPTSTPRALLLVALVFGAAACSTNLLHGLDEGSANETIAALERAGIATEKVADEGSATAFTVRNRGTTRARRWTCCARWDCRATAATASPRSTASRA